MAVMDGRGRTTTNEAIRKAYNLIDNGSVLKIKPLSNSERDELDKLESESKLELRNKRVEAFVKSSPSLRDAIINEVLNYSLMSHLDRIQPIKTDRQIELENRNNDQYHDSQVGLDYHNRNAYAFPRILNYFTEEEIIEIHKQAAVEGMLNE